MKPKLVYLGPEQTYSYEVASRNFKREAELYWVKPIDKVVEEVSDDRAELGVIPFWNSYEDHIKQGQTQELIISAKDIFVRDILIHNIKLNLLSNYPLSEIKNIYSAHPVYNQCKKFLERYLPSAEFIPVDSTAEGARIASEKEFSAAIGSIAAGKEAGLGIKKKNIHRPKNRTLFFVVQKNVPQLRDYVTPYALFLIKVDYENLIEVVDLLSSHKLRMSQNWERRKDSNYQFVEVECFQAGLDFHSFIRDATDKFGDVRLLGMYKNGLYNYLPDLRLSLKI